MKTPVFYLIPLLLLFTSCGLLDNNEEPERPDIPGKIVFSADDGNGRSQIFTMNANGSDLNKITNLKNGNEAFAPSWNLENSNIIFSTSLRSSSNGPSLYVMDANGSNMRPLYKRENSHIPLAGSHAKWNPDGTKIAYQFCTNCQIQTNYEIFIFDNISKELTQLTNHPANDINPIWSPDGNKIAFATNRNFHGTDSGQFIYDLYEIDIKSLEMNRLTNNETIGSFDWVGPDTLLVTKTNKSTNAKNIFILNSNTGEEKALISNLMVREFWTSVNPKDKKIFTINKKHQELPVTFSIYNSNGRLLEQADFNISVLATGLNFSWSIQTD